MTPAERQRARRAAARLRLTGDQAERARRLLRDDRGNLEAARALLRECRAQLRAALASPGPDAAAVLELSVQERLLAQRERALAARLEASLAALLSPAQAVRLRALPPGVLVHVLSRLDGAPGAPARCDGRPSGLALDRRPEAAQPLL